MHLYEVAIIQPDLRHEETIIQAVNSLVHLESVITDVFDRIDARIDRNHNKIAELNKRLDVANAKGQLLIGMKQAIKVYSSADYPAPICPEIALTFRNSLTASASIATANTRYTVTTPLDPIGSLRSADDKLKFFHVRPPSTGNRASAAQLAFDAGLGDAPAYIDSINTFLLFNESENIYQNYRRADNLCRSRKVKAPASATRRQDDDENKLPAAPLSISQRSIINRRPNDELFYSPTLNEAPQIDVPLDLPDLPGIAADVVYFEQSSTGALGFGGGGGGGIMTGAPSLLMDLPDLPEVLIDAIDTKKLQSQPPPLFNDISTIEVSLADVVQQPPPPPPPQSVQQPLLLTPAPAPPPPPPPPPAVLSVPLAPQIGAIENKSTSIPSDRSTLMEAIRQAGGKAKLRVAQDDRSNNNSPVPVRMNIFFYVGNYNFQFGNKFRV